MEYNFFEQFQGADLDRLSECLKAIRQAGLKTDKYNGLSYSAPVEAQSR